MSSHYVPVETKYRDYEFSGSAISNNGWTQKGQILSGVAQGVGNSQRQGMKYAIKSIHVRGHVRTTASEDGSGTTGALICGIALVLNRQTNGTALDTADIFDETLVSTDHPTLSFRKLESLHRFKILKHWTRALKLGEAVTRNLASPALVTIGIVRESFEFNVNFKEPLIVTCTGTADTVGSVLDNSISLIATRDSFATAENPTVELDYYSKIRS
jgi:hypothetical protein